MLALSPPHQHAIQLFPTPTDDALERAGSAYRKIVGVYRLDRIEKELEDVWAGYDPAKVRAAIDNHARIWADRDANAMIAELYRAREAGCRNKLAVQRTIEAAVCHTLGENAPAGLASGNRVA